MQETEKITEGWYVCIRNGKELEMYYDGDKWHLSAYDTNDVVHRRIAKPPDQVLRKH